ncbi:MAG: hypothetical protein AB7U61_06610 [Methylocystis sp.]
MSHHGWVGVIPETSLAKALQSPFGRLFPARSHSYGSHAISLLAGAFGPLQEQEGPPSSKPRNEAGFTFFGQFIDHDLTEFRVVGPEFAFIPQNPIIGQRQRVLEDGDPTTTNGRTGRLDLDSVYGLLGGPDLELFDDDGRFRLRESGSKAVDIVRQVDYRDGRLIADPRNDENKIVVQLHVLFERLHNKLHIEASEGGTEALLDAISATRARVSAIYRRIVLFDYLPRVADPDVVVSVWARLASNNSLYQQMNRRVRTALDPLLDPLLTGPLQSDDGPAADAVRKEILANLIAMPVEFSHAAFRLGHSQLLDGYKLNPGKSLPLFFTGRPPMSGDPRDLRGNAPIEDDLIIRWADFFGAAAQKGGPLDASLPASVFRLPPPTIGEPPISLAERNIRRGVDFGLPSGQEVASSLDAVYGNVSALTADEVLPDSVRALYPEVLSVEPSLSVTTPLWFYILRESEIQAASETHLGSVGSYIVAETILGSLAATRGFDLATAMNDYLLKVEDVKTASSSSENDIFTFVHLLKFLGEPGF